jgi:pimeloyl-ACP methyl ester carboxylesterase
MGALMAQEIALSRPDLVAGAVLMATRARLSAFETLQLEAFYSLREVTEQHPAVMAYLSLPYYVPLSGEAYSDDEVMAPIIEMLRQPWPAGNHEAPKEDEDWHDYGLNYEDRRPALSGISVPCMVLAFELDGCTFPRLCREVAETIPRCQYAEIVGAGHLGASTHRAEVLEAVLPFFDSFADAPS